MESINPKCHKSLQWLLDHEIDSPEDGAASGLDLTFSMDDNVFGSTSNVELKPGGVHIAVNDANKREFVQLMTERIMTIAIADQIGAFLDGFHELVPHSLIAMFDAYELELLISGVPQIDLDVRSTQRSILYFILFYALCPLGLAPQHDLHRL